MKYYASLSYRAIDNIRSELDRINLRHSSSDQDANGTRDQDLFQQPNSSSSEDTEVQFNIPQEPGREEWRKHLKELPWPPVALTMNFLTVYNQEKKKKHYKQPPQVWLDCNHEIPNHV